MDISYSMTVRVTEYDWVCILFEQNYSISKLKKYTILADLRKKKNHCNTQTRIPILFLRFIGETVREVNTRQVDHLTGIKSKIADSQLSKSSQ